VQDLEVLHIECKEEMVDLALAMSGAACCDPAFEKDYLNLPLYHIDTLSFQSRLAKKATIESSFL